MRLFLAAFVFLSMIVWTGCGNSTKDHHDHETMRNQATFMQITMSMQAMRIIILIMTIAVIMLKRRVSTA